LTHERQPTSAPDGADQAGRRIIWKRPGSTRRSIGRDLPWSGSVWLFGRLGCDHNQISWSIC